MNDRDSEDIPSSFCLICSPCPFWFPLPQLHLPPFLLLSSAYHEKVWSSNPHFKLSFQPTDVDNQYRIHTWPGIASCVFRDLPQDRILRLASYNTQYELPHPLLLEVHQVIASILHATGRAEVVENIQRDSDGIKVLANDGSTNIADLLSITSLSAQSIPNTSIDFPSRYLVSSW